MRVLLTGAAGFIGTAVSTLLEAGDHDVVAVDALIPQAHRHRNPDDPAPDDPNPRADLHRLDVRDADQWRGLLRGVDAVCHQAALVGVGTSVADLPQYASHNDLGTATLLAAMHDTGVRRLVLASSMVVYGEGHYICPEHGARRVGDRDPGSLAAGRFDHACDRCGRSLAWRTIPEDTRVDPRTSYAASKVAQEHYAAAWSRQAGGRVVALRYHNVYGPRMPRDTPYSGVAAIFRSALERGQRPQVFEDGGQMRDFVHVTDVAEANRAALLAVVADAVDAFEAFNVCSGTPVSVVDVARMLASEAGLEPEVTGEFRPGDVRHVVASPDRLRQRLGVTARVPPNVGIPGFRRDSLR